jgi:hypothetical protein
MFYIFGIQTVKALETYIILVVWIKSTIHAIYLILSQYKTGLLQERSKFHIYEGVTVFALTPVVVIRDAHLIPLPISDLLIFSATSVARRVSLYVCVCVLVRAVRKKSDSVINKPVNVFVLFSS